MPDERVVVDTTAWSLLIRRQGKDLSASNRHMVRNLRELIGTGKVVLLGVVRMEILSGIFNQDAFNRIEDHLDAFEDVPADTDDYVRAALFSNHCRQAGVASSPIDMIICSVASGRDLAILTTDKDFARYAVHLPIRVHQASDIA